MVEEQQQFQIYLKESKILFQLGENFLVKSLS